MKIIKEAPDKYIISRFIRANHRRLLIEAWEEEYGEIEFISINDQIPCIKKWSNTTDSYPTSSHLAFCTVIEIIPVKVCYLV